MLINATQSRLVIGRFSILPGDKVPAVPMTSTETIAVKACLEKKLLVEKETPVTESEPVKAVNVPAKVNKVRAKVEVASSTEKPAENADSQ